MINIITSDLKTETLIKDRSDQSFDETNMTRDVSVVSKENNNNNNSENSGSLSDCYGTETGNKENMNEQLKKIISSSKFRKPSKEKPVETCLKKNQIDPKSGTESLLSLKNGSYYPKEEKRRYTSAKDAEYDDASLFYNNCSPNKLNCNKNKEERRCSTERCDGLQFNNTAPRLIYESSPHSHGRGKRAEDNLLSGLESQFVGSAAQFGILNPLFDDNFRNETKTHEETSILLRDRGDKRDSYYPGAAAKGGCLSRERQCIRNRYARDRRSPGSNERRAGRDEDVTEAKCRYLLDPANYPSNSKTEKKKKPKDKHKKKARETSNSQKTLIGPEYFDLDYISATIDSRNLEVIQNFNALEKEFILNKPTRQPRVNKCVDISLEVGRVNITEIETRRSDNPLVTVPAIKRNSPIHVNKRFSLPSDNCNGFGSQCREVHSHSKKTLNESDLKIPDCLRWNCVDTTCNHVTCVNNTKSLKSRNFWLLPKSNTFSTTKIINETFDSNDEYTPNTSMVNSNSDVSLANKEATLKPGVLCISSLHSEKLSTLKQSNSIRFEELSPEKQYSIDSDMPSTVKLSSSLKSEKLPTADHSSLNSETFKISASTNYKIEKRTVFPENKSKLEMISEPDVSISAQPQDLEHCLSIQHPLLYLSNEVPQSLPCPPDIRPSSVSEYSDSARDADSSKIHQSEDGPVPETSMNFSSVPYNHLPSLTPDTAVDTKHKSGISQPLSNNSGNAICRDSNPVQYRIENDSMASGVRSKASGCSVSCCGRPLATTPQGAGGNPPDRSPGRCRGAPSSWSSSPSSSLSSSEEDSSSSSDSSSDFEDIADLQV